MPALASLPIVWAIVALLYRGRWQAAPAAAPAPAAPAEAAPEVNRWETAKAALVTAGVVLAFVLSDWPRELVALSGAALLLVNRQIASTDMLRHVDGNLLLLLMGLFIVNAALAATGLPQRLLADLRGLGFDLDQPLALYAVVSVLSNVIGNNPAVMLLVPYLGTGGRARRARRRAGARHRVLVEPRRLRQPCRDHRRRAGEGARRRHQLRRVRPRRVPVALGCLAVGAVWIAMIAG